MAYPAIVSYSWDFGDGNTSSQQNPEHSYALPGTYFCTLTVTDSDGNTATKSYKVLVSWFRVLTYTWDFDDGGASLQQNPSHVYQDPGVYTATLEILDINGETASKWLGYKAGYNYPEISSYRWDFGDGSISNQQNPRKVYTGKGRYSVSLTVTDSDGNTATKAFFIDSHLQGVAGYSWDFGDGQVSNEQNPSHIFVDVGYYTVRLVVTDFEGATARKTFFFRTFGTSTRSRLWTFGDGFTSKEKNPRHVYMPGTYNVTLTVRDIYANRGRVVRNNFITVEGVSITGYPQTGTAPLTVKFGFSQ